MTWAITAVAAVATVGSIASSEKARQEQKRATRVQGRVRAAQTARESMAAVREQRIAQAQIVQGAASQGTGGSSGAQGGYSAVGSLTGGNIQFINQMDNFQSQIAKYQERASKYQAQGSMFQAAGNLAMMGLSMAKPATPSQSAPTGAMSNAGSQSSSINNAAQPWLNPLPPRNF